MALGPFRGLGVASIYPRAPYQRQPSISVNSIGIQILGTPAARVAPNAARVWQQQQRQHRQHDSDDDDDGYDGYN
eukprot:6168592-Pyramimonas_sp.AAC.1